MMNNDSPLISVIIPVYNGDRYLAEAIESILAQNYHPIEIIIIDDGSTDNTWQVVNNFRQYVNYTCQPNLGAPTARNAGLKIAVGNFIAFLDADDIWAETKLELQIDLLNKNPLIEIILGYQQTIYPTKFVDGKPEFGKYHNPMMALQLGTGLFRKSAFDRVGLFDEELRHADDWDWFMRARELKVLMSIHPETVLFYRRHDRNMTNQVEVGNQYLAKMFKKSLDRRREQNSGLAISLPNLSDFQVKNTNDLL